MNYAVIDVGSNSVRLLKGGIKTSVNTQLAERLMQNGFLLESAIERTADAVLELKREAEKDGGVHTFVFATEAVRSATNGDTFRNLLLERGIELDILSSKQEAKIGFLGAYNGKNGEVKGVLDVGGASSELAVGREEELLYSYSLPIGAVRLKDFSDDRRTLESYIAARVAEYGDVPPFDDLITIGGTTSSLASVHLALEPYDPVQVHNTRLSYEDIDRTVTKIFETPVPERLKIKGLHPQKILLVPTGGLLVMGIMRKLGLKDILVSERDNLEGYLSEIMLLEKTLTAVSE